MAGREYDSYKAHVGIIVNCCYRYVLWTRLGAFYDM